VVLVVVVGAGARVVVVVAAVLAVVRAVVVGTLVVVVVVVTNGGTDVVVVVLGSGRIWARAAVDPQPSAAGASNEHSQAAAVTAAQRGRISLRCAVWEPRPGRIKLSDF
jgi:hypothetical protein